MIIIKDGVARTEYDTEVSVIDLDQCAADGGSYSKSSILMVLDSDIPQDRAYAVIRQIVEA